MICIKSFSIKTCNNFAKLIQLRLINGEMYLKKLDYGFHSKQQKQFHKYKIKEFLYIYFIYIYVYLK